MGRRRHSQDACARLLEVRNPGWRAEYRPRTGLYHAARISPHGGGLVPPFLAHADPSAVDAAIRRDEALTGELRARLYELRDKGLLPDWDGLPPPMEMAPRSAVRPRPSFPGRESRRHHPTLSEPSDVGR
ncbi:hypothetical protein HDA32_002000 [Spinactinospora alkalitolerans]|uniref:Uncharacterized protein n=1 Tax=Spinactinospora alkalitolerans TaxID=687207 RepID=A0A852TYH4_9ACTN|nr:hypothetical protein [Spinactinospora alkalitolerans]